MPSNFSQLSSARVDLKSLKCPTADQRADHIIHGNSKLIENLKLKCCVKYRTQDNILTWNMKYYQSIE